VPDESVVGAEGLLDVDCSFDRFPTTVEQGGVDPQAGRSAWPGPDMGEVERRRPAEDLDPESHLLSGAPWRWRGRLLLAHKAAFAPSQGRRGR
jgi:hypothetical protein